jgi:hypothetical protein
MPWYTFQLRDGSCTIDDDVGVRLSDRNQALRYAQDTALELMSGCEREARSWRLDVHEDGGERVFAITFASLDPTLDHLGPDWRRQIEELSERYRLLKEAVSAAQLTMRESRALVALSRGKPYVAAEFGQQTIRC